MFPEFALLLSVPFFLVPAGASRSCHAAFVKAPHLLGALHPALSGSAYQYVCMPPARRDFVAVEHPCWVRDSRRAVASLGGAREVARAFANPPHILQCSLRPADPLSHPLYGERVARPAVLLRVRRRRARDGEPAGPAQAEVVGALSQSVRFSGLADLQHVSSPALISALSRPWEQAPPAAAAVGGGGPTSAPPPASSEPRDGAPPPQAAVAPPPGEGVPIPHALAGYALSIPPSSFLSSDLPHDLLPRRPGLAARQQARCGRDVAEI